ncbi:MAG: hypothetical protein LBI82_04255 [Dysgonamonadaceae bacterium]|jgi:hypothetical protein|nr:hypothetical protein [Dysgonamonadaceae bacterium]
MKKLSYFLLATLVCFSLFFVSCKKDDPVNNDSFGESTKPVDNSEILSFPFSKLTPEEQKEKLQSEANAFLAALNDLPNSTCLKTLKAFDALLSINSPEIGNFNLNSSKNIIYIKDFYGKYTWNSLKKTWTVSENSSQLEFNFPTGTASARIVITGVASNAKTETHEEYYDYDKGKYVEITNVYELPKELTAKIYSSDKEVGSIELKSNIVDDQTPPSLSALKYVMDEYVLTMAAERKTPNVISSTLKKGNQVLINATADLSYNVDNAINGKEPGDMKANMVIRILNNLAIAGNMDIDKYTAADNKAYKTYEEKAYEIYDKYWNDEISYEQAIQLMNGNEEVYYNASAKAFNDNTLLYIASLKDKAKFARMIQTAKEYSESWETYDWDYDWDYYYETGKFRYYDNGKWVYYDEPRTNIPILIGIVAILSSLETNHELIPRFISLKDLMYS